MPAPPAQHRAGRDAPCVRVPHDVRDGLLGDPVAGGLDLGREPLVGDVTRQTTAIPVRPPPAGSSSERRREPDVVEDGRPQVEGRAPHLASAASIAARLSRISAPLAPVRASTRSSERRFSRTVVSAWPTTSWSSRAIRARSASFAATAPRRARARTSSTPRRRPVLVGRSARLPAEGTTANLVPTGECLPMCDPQCRLAAGRRPLQPSPASPPTSLSPPQTGLRAG